MQNTVLEMLKTWYFAYSAFWLAGQLGGGYRPPPAPPPPGYATGTAHDYLLVLDFFFFDI